MSLNQNWRKKIKPEREVLDRTEIILNTLRREQCLPSIQKYSYQPFMIQLDRDYLDISNHIPLKYGVDHLLSLTAYEQVFFTCKGIDIVFPLVIHLKEVKGRAFLYSSFENPHPGIELQKGRSKIQKQLKVIIVEAKKIILDKSHLESVQQIYLGFSAVSQVFTASFRIEEELSEKNKQKTQKFGKSSLQHQKTEYLQRKSNELQHKRIKTQYEVLKCSEGNYLPKKVAISRTPDQQLPPDFIKISQTNLARFRRSKTQSFHLFQRECNREQQLRTKTNLCKIQRQKQLRRDLQGMAASLKQLISKQKSLQQLRDELSKKSIKMVRTMMAISIFCHKMNKTAKNFQQCVQEGIFVQFITAHFCACLFRNYRLSISNIRSFKTRNLMPVFHTSEFSCKIMSKTAKKKSIQLIIAMLGQIKSSLLINHALNRAGKYKNAVKIIQRRWLIRHGARMVILIKFAKKHVKNMIEEHPHLRLFLPKFECGNNYEQICFRYLCDQTVKYQKMWGEFQHKRSQYQKVKEMNSLIEKWNQTQPLRRQKKMISIQKVQKPPSERLFRDLDILRSMLRAYFELQYKKSNRKKLHF